MVKCFICDRSPHEHDEAEAAGKINHKFATDGRVERSTARAGTRAEARSQPTVQVMVVPAPDMALRRLLLDEGVLTHAQLDSLVDVSPVVKVPVAEGMNASTSAGASD